MRIEVLADVKTTLGEGPLWDVEEQRLHWIDSFDGRFIAGSTDTMEKGQMPMFTGSTPISFPRGGYRHDDIQSR